MQREKELVGTCHAEEEPVSLSLILLKNKLSRFVHLLLNRIYSALLCSVIHR